MPKPDRQHGSDTQPGNDTELELPQPLVADLRAALSGKVDVSRDVDAGIWAAARRHSLQQQKHQRRRVLVRWIQATTAAAAAIAFATWISWPAGHLAAPNPSAPPPALAAADFTPLDGSRRLDILDAFTLAKRVETQKPVHASWDVNKDGSVDYRDVDLIAARAVTLEERTLQ